MKKTCLFILTLISGIQAIAQNVDYSIPLYTTQTFTKTIDPALPVGSIPGSGNVSPSGGATYSIPISVPPGTNGIAPTISIDYHSSGGNGAAGNGWNISGLSVISRAGQTIHHHGQVTTPDLSSNDRFALDGQMLMSLSGIYGANGATYGAESEDFSIVTSNGVSGTGPAWFKIVTKDGIEMEYGNTADSRVMDEANVNVLFWRMNRVRYPDGNYIDFKYLFTDRDSRIDEINYTGNTVTGLSPYNKIKFEYKVRADINGQFLANSLVTSKYLLDKISVTAEGSISKSYQFRYSWDNINSYLREVTESGSDGSSLNSTIFKYGDAAEEYTNAITTIPTGDNIESFAGDYDGDGLDDILTANYALSNGLKFYSQFKVFKRTAANASYSLLSTTALPASYSLVKVGRSGPYESKNASNLLQDDFNGDGVSDVLALNFSVQANDIFLENAVLLKSTNAGTSFTAQARPISLPTGKKININGNYFHAGDFNGDGISEFITILGTAGNVYTPVLHSDFITGGASSAISISGPSSITLGTWVDAKTNVLDFNGDGKSDLMLVSSQTCEIYTFSGSVAQRIYSGNFPIKQQNLFFGDFNGDGKTDVLAQSGKTVVRGISTGSAFSNSNVTLTEPIGNSPCPSDRQIYVGDFNGDGRSDFAHNWMLASEFPVNAVPVDPNLATYLVYTGLNIFYSQGNTFFSKKIYSTEVTANGNCSSSLSNLRKYVQGDLNGDGKTDLIYYNTLNTIICSSFNADGKENLLHKIANGLGHVTEWNYKKLPEGGPFYIKGQASIYPVNNIQPATYAVSDFIVQNGIGGTSGIQYAYEDARLHRAGKGYLGFKKVIVSNQVSGIKTISEVEFNSTFNVNVPQKTATYMISTNSLISQTTMANEFLNLGGKRFHLRVKSSTENNVFEGRTTSSVNNTFDNFGNVTQNTVNNNNIETTVTTTVYGAYPGAIPNKPTSITVSKTRSGQAAFTVTTGMGYNNLGQLTSKTDFSGLPKSVSTVLEYYPLGNLKKSTVTPSGLAVRATSAVYDAKGRYPESSTNELNQTSTATYDLKWGKPLTATGIDGLKTSFTYDAFGRAATTVYPEGYTVTNSYGWDIANGAVWFNLVAHPGKPDVKTWFDVLGREIRTQTEAFPSGWTTQTTSYDNRGNVATSTQPVKSGEPVLTTTNSYNAADPFNRLSATSNALTSSTLSYTYNAGILTTTSTNSGQSASTSTDATGNTISATDNGGTLSYTYYSHGGLKEVSNGAVITSSQYDMHGRQTSLTDQNAGTTTYDYNALGQLVSQTNANNKTHTMQYDLLGRMFNRNGPEGITVNEYYPSGSGASTNQLKKVTGFSGDLEEFAYDNFGRLQTAKQTVDATVFTTTYGYNSYGDVTSLLYPSGFGTTHGYDANGYPMTIKNGNSSVTLYTNTNMNGLGQNTAYSLGNGKSSTITYNYGIPKQFTTAGIQNLELTWDYAKGNLDKRKDYIKNKEESFTYDNLNRLLNATVLGKAAQTTTYQPSGNISSKSDAGQTFSYHSTKPNALTGVASPTTAIPILTQEITYTAFNQPEKLTENGSGQPYELTYTYGADYQRLKGVMKKNAALINTHYYFGSYEKDVTPGIADKHLHYISSPAGMIAIVIRENGADQYYYTYTDHLGSLLTLTAFNGTVILDQNFDAWGRLRNPTDWTFVNVPAPTSYLYRGFTGHEHLTNFNLINMNGRMYDPVVGRVLSVDNYVQDAFGTQDYNRYSYAKNNPLKYRDPDGNNPLIGALIGGLGYAISTGFSDGGFKNWDWGGFAMSVAAGAITSGFSSFIGSATAGISNGVVRAGVQLAAHGLVNGAVSHVQGGSFLNGFATGAAGSLMGTATAGLNTGLQIGASAAFGGVVSELSGGNFWKGAAQAGIIAGFNHAAHALDDHAAARLQRRILSDGRLSLGEANDWYRRGGGRELTVDASKLDLGWVSDDGWDNFGRKDLQTLPFSRDGLVHGSIRLERLSSQTAKIQSAPFDFEQHGTYFSRPFRNTFTAWGRGLATNFGLSSGTGYTINYYGKALINQYQPFIPYR